MPIDRPTLSSHQWPPRWTKRPRTRWRYGLSSTARSASRPNDRVWPGSRLHSSPQNSTARRCEVSRPSFAMSPRHRLPPLRSALGLSPLVRRHIPELSLSSCCFIAFPSFSLHQPSDRRPWTRTAVPRHHPLRRRHPSTPPSRTAMPPPRIAARAGQRRGSGPAAPGPTTAAGRSVATTDPASSCAGGTWAPVGRRRRGRTSPEPGRGPTSSAPIESTTSGRCLDQHREQSLRRAHPPRRRAVIDIGPQAGSQRAMRSVARVVPAAANEAASPIASAELDRGPGRRPLRTPPIRRRTGVVDRRPRRASARSS